MSIYKRRYTTVSCNVCGEAGGFSSNAELFLGMVKGAGMVHSDPDYCRSVLARKREQLEKERAQFEAQKKAV